MIESDLKITQDEEEHQKALAEILTGEEPVQEKAIGILLDNVIE